MLAASAYSDIAALVHYMLLVLFSPRTRFALAFFAFACFVLAILIPTGLTVLGSAAGPGCTHGSVSELHSTHLAPNRSWQKWGV